MIDRGANSEYPYTKEDKDRLIGYEYYKMLFNGEHFSAFNLKIHSAAYGTDYAKLRYVVANFAGLISKVCADMLFSEPPTIKAEGNQDFVDAFVKANKLNMQNYESALQNSFYGDAVYKLRIAPKNPKDKESTIILEDNTPVVYFPKLQNDNVRAEPEYKELSFKIMINGESYLRKEIHEIGLIRNELWLMEGGIIKYQVPLTHLGENAPTDEQQTGVDRWLVEHIPNWKVGERVFGYSDYYDLGSLFYAVNNRFTKIDNILDTHSDPILALPEGVLDEKGQVRREKFKMFEMPPSVGGETPQKPEYVVWDASLASAFDEIDHLVDMMYMISEISPDVLGMGKGANDSGRALKLKLLRTIAKVKRKKLYYDQALKDVLRTAQELSVNGGYKVEGILSNAPVDVQIVWQDGLPEDLGEAINNEVKRKDAGLTTTKDSIIRLDGLDDAQAEAKAKEIDDQQKINMPVPKIMPNPIKAV